MAFVFDTQTGNITLPRGDTGNINVSVNYDELKEGDAIVFAIFDKYTGEDFLIKAADIVDGKAVIRICNHDTRGLVAKSYNWNLRIVTDPTRDENGNVVADECTDDVITVFQNPPKFKLTNGGAYV